MQTKIMKLVLAMSAFYYSGLYALMPKTKLHELFKQAAALIQQEISSELTQDIALNDLDVGYAELQLCLDEHRSALSESTIHAITQILHEYQEATTHQHTMYVPTRVNGFKYHPTLLVSILNVQKGIYSTGPVLITRKQNERALGITGKSFFNGDVTLGGRLITINNRGTDIIDNNFIIDGNLTVNGTITGTISGTVTNAVNITGPFQGDMTNFQNATVVSFVGGQTALAVGTAASAVANATDAATPNTLVRRDGTGSFSGTLNGNSTGFSGQLTGDVSGNQTTTQVDFVGGQPASAIADATAAATAATSANVPNTLVLRDANGGFASGSHVISNTIGDSLTVSRNINMLKPDFGDATTGTIQINSNRFISTFDDFANTFIGTLAGNSIGLALGGLNNTMIGSRAGASIGIGVSNATFIGAQAGVNSTAGSNNTAIGFGTLSNILQNSNTAVGDASLSVATTANSNTCFGDSAGIQITSGSFNTYIGNGSSIANTTGANNCCAGMQSGRFNAIGSSDICLGVNAGTAYTNESNNIVIGNAGLAGDVNIVRIGNNTHTALFLNADNTGAADPGIAINPGGTETLSIGIVGGGVPGQVYRTVSSCRYKENIKALPESVVQNILALQPKSFTIKGHSIINYGLIAEEVDLVNKDLVMYNGKAQPESVNYPYIVPMLIATLQAQQKILDTQRADIAFLQHTISQAREQIKN